MRRDVRLDQVAEVLCAAVCRRCALGGWNPVWGDGGYVHTGETLESGVSLPPEPCQANALRQAIEALLMADEKKVSRDR